MRGRREQELAAGLPAKALRQGVDQIAKDHDSMRAAWQGNQQRETHERANEL